MSGTALKLALVGTGNFPFNVLYPMLRNQPVELVGICDTDPAKTARFAGFYRAGRAYTDYREMIRAEKPEALICVVNREIHYEVGKFCLERGINVLTEKAPCASAAQAGELAALQEKSGAFMGVAFNRRWGTGYMLAKQTLEKAEFGKPAMLYTKFNTKAYRDLDFFVYNHISHLIDLAVFLLGELSAPVVQTLIRGEHSGAMGIHCTALASGALCTIQSAAMEDEAYPMERLDIAAEGGNLIVDNWRDFYWDRTGPERDRHFDAPLENTGDALAWRPAGGYGIGRGIFSYMGFEALLDEFIRAARGERRFSCTIREVLPTMRFIDQVLEQIPGRG
jgi:predicted dehydrogenase